WYVGPPVRPWVHPHAFIPRVRHGHRHQRPAKLARCQAGTSRRGRVSARTHTALRGAWLRVGWRLRTERRDALRDLGGARPYQNQGPHAMTLHDTRNLPTPRTQAELEELVQDELAD